MQTRTAADQIKNYLTDASNMSGGRADRVVVPESVDELRQVMRLSNEQGTAVTISGARTGTVGGAIPFGGTIVSLEKLNKITSIDKPTQTAIVEPGVILADLTKAAEAEGLFYPPDPTEWSCQVGGTVATNASGARSFKYGATREFVRRLKVVLADGEILDIRRGANFADENGIIRLTTEGGREIISKPLTYERPNVRKNASGYFNGTPLDAIDLFIGSEGTLGVIVEIELALLPRPEGFFSGVVFFNDQAQMLSFVNEATNASFDTRRGRSDGGVQVDASLLEYFDDRSLQFIAEKFPDTPTGAAGAIYFEQETTALNEDVLLERWEQMLEDHDADVDRSWFTTTEVEREKLRAFRHALPVAVNERIAKYKQRKVGTDMAVPDENFPAFLRFYKETLEASGLDHVIFGHIGDAHLHANMLPKDAVEAEKARHIYGRCIAQAIMLGGCVSAEHGIGKLKRKYLSVMMGERYLNEMADLKRVFDPKGILGRGNIIDESFLSQ